MNDNLRIDRNVVSDDGILGQIGRFIRHHRIQQNKTQDMLAKDAGISRSTLSLLERGETVTIATLIQALRVLDKLQALEGFDITQQQSPILLAKAEKKKRQRVILSRKKETSINDW
jgi:Helix-turn-helix.